MTGAQFSIQFTLAMTAVKGDNDFTTYLEAGRGRYRDPAILALAHRVTVGLDEECDRAFPDQWLGRVTVTTNDGRVLETTALGKRAVSDEEIVTKFRGLAGTVLSAQHVDEIMQRVEGLEDLRSIGELTSLLTTRRAP
jgi:2-methylcitrate dehydratase PrpD